MRPRSAAIDSGTEHIGQHTVNDLEKIYLGVAPVATGRD